MEVTSTLLKTISLLNCKLGFPKVTMINKLCKTKFALCLTTVRPQLGFKFIIHKSFACPPGAQRMICVWAVFQWKIYVFKAYQKTPEATKHVWSEVKRRKNVEKFDYSSFPYWRLITFFSSQRSFDTFFSNNEKAGKLIIRRGLHDRLVQNLAPSRNLLRSTSAILVLHQLQ
jgi:hypothetical protein